MLKGIMKKILPSSNIDKIVYAFTPYAWLAHTYPIAPAHNFIPNWVKTSAKKFKERLKDDEYSAFTQTGVHRCPAIIDLYREGFIIPCPSDILFEFNEDYTNVRWRFFGSENISCELMPTEGLFGPDYGEEFFKDIVKIVLPITIVSLKPGVRFLFNPVSLPDDKDFTVAPGIYDTDLTGNINIQLNIKKKERFVLIKSGTPLVHLIPLEKNVKIITKAVTGSEYRILSEEVSRFVRGTAKNRNFTKIKRERR